MLAARELRELGPATTERQTKGNIVQAIDQVAKRLGNTRATCRKYYIHPALLDAYQQGIVPPPVPDAPTEKREQPATSLRRHEDATLEFIRSRLSASPTPPSPAS
jgi:DNA topoisomerase-1